jgi:hypothetical protein
MFAVIHFFTHGLDEQTGLHGRFLVSSRGLSVIVVRHNEREAESFSIRTHRDVW